MEKDFEQLLNDRMEQASLKELMPEFDRDTEWATLSQKLRPSKNRNLWLMWSHAAAILLGVFISWFLLKESRHNKPATDNPVVKAQLSSPVDKTPSLKGLVSHIVPAQRSPVVRKMNKMEAIMTKRTQKNKLPKINIKQNPPSIMTDTNMIAQRQNEKEIKLEQITDANNNKKPLPVPAMAAVKKPRQQALHLLDIDNEDRQFIINEIPEKRSANGILTQIQYLITKPDGFVATQDNPYLIRSIFIKQ